MSQYDFIIIGAGVSAMTFAQRAAENGKNILILEKKPAAGGCLTTMTHEDFWLELGGHTIYSSYASYISAMKDAGMQDDFLPRKKAPFRMLTKKGLQPITSVMNFFELMLNGYKLFYLKKAGKTVREYYSAVLGKGNYENMFRPMIQAVISQDGSDCPADLLLKSRPKDKTMPRHFTINKGMNSYIQNIAGMKNVTVKTSCGALSAELSDGVYTVKTETDETFTADNLVMACHAQMTAELIKGFAPKIASFLSAIPCANVESMGIIVNKDDISLEPLSFIVAQDGSFTSVVARDVVPDEKYRGFAFHFKPNKLSYDEKTDIAENILGINRSLFVKVQEAAHLSPTLTKGHEEMIAKVDTLLPETKGLYIVGNYFGGLAIEDCASRSAVEVARALS